MENAVIVDLFKSYFRLKSRILEKSIVQKCFYLFHDGCPYNVETSPLICSVNQWTSVMKELKIGTLKIPNNSTENTRGVQFVFRKIAIASFCCLYLEAVVRRCSVKLTGKQLTWSSFLINKDDFIAVVSLRISVNFSETSSISCFYLFILGQKLSGYSDVLILDLDLDFARKVDKKL